MVIANCCIKPSVLKQKPRKVQIFRKADWSKLKSLMADFRDRFINEHFGKSVEDLWNEFKTAIDQFSTQCIPTKLIRGKSSFPWITQEIRRMIRKPDHIYRRFKKTGAQETYIKFLQLRKEIKHKIKASYNLYLEGLLGLNDSNNDCDSKKLFTFLKNSSQDQLGSSPLKQNDNLVTDSSINANIHNQQFQSVFTVKGPLSLSRLCKMKLKDMTDQGIISADSAPPETLSSVPPIEDFRISVEGILKLFKNLKPGKASGPDKLKPRLLQELCNENAPVLQIIFERSLQTGKIPSDWSKALVAQIFKKGDKSSAANYRPISLTCILCKVLEHIIASNVVEHMNKYDLLYDLQHGFREKRSCETQLTMMVEELARNACAGKQTDLILLDFSKAFDKVSHSKLL